MASAMTAAAAAKNGGRTGETVVDICAYEKTHIAIAIVITFTDTNDRATGSICCPFSRATGRPAALPAPAA